MRTDLKNTDQRHGISPGRWLPLVTHIGDQLLTFLLEVRNGDDPLCPRLRCCNSFTCLCWARGKIEIGRLWFFRGRGQGRGRGGGHGWSRTSASAGIEGVWSKTGAATTSTAGTRGARWAALPPPVNSLKVLSTSPWRSSISSRAAARPSKIFDAARWRLIAVSSISKWYISLLMPASNLRSRLSCAQHDN